MGLLKALPSGPAGASAYPRRAVPGAPIDDSARLSGLLDQVLDLDPLLIIREFGGQFAHQDFVDLCPANRSMLNHHADDHIHIVLVAQPRPRALDTRRGHIQDRVRHDVMRMRPVDQPFSLQLQMGLRADGQPFLHPVQEHDLLQVQVRSLQEQAGVRLAEQAAVDRHLDVAVLGQVVVRQREEALPLHLDHLPNAASLRVDDAECIHGACQERVAIPRSGRVPANNGLNASGQKRTGIVHDDAVGELHC